MALSKPALACAGGAAVLAATAVAGQRVGLALTLALLLATAAGMLAAQRSAARDILALALALALQPFLRDAGWVVAVDVSAAFAASLLAAGRLKHWSGMRRSLLAPCKLISVLARPAGWGRALAPVTPSNRMWPAVRGVVLAVVLTATFGALFASADSAFAGMLDETFTADLDAADLTWRLVLALAFVLAAGAIAQAGTGAGAGDGATGNPRRRGVLGRVELVIALGAVVALFATFVAVQLRVLFGGAAYVQSTTGLGYGEYARQGFVALLIVAALTLALVAFAARRRDRSVRALLGVLCVLTLVVLLSAYHRLDLVEQAYGFTRVRYAGHAIVIWLASIFGLVLSAGVSRAIARALPRLVTTFTLAGVLAFSLSNPDGRIAQRAVDRAVAGGEVDTGYLRGLSADALPALDGLPPRQRAAVLPELRARLQRPDGLAGLNLARARAR